MVGYDPMTAKNKKLIIAGVAVFALGALILYVTQSYWKPISPVSAYRSADFSFTYPRTYTLNEYSRGVASIGIQEGDMFSPLIEATTYRNDPDQPLPKSFADFIAAQAQNLCGADGGGESISCSAVVAKPYTSPLGLLGQELSMTLTKKNLVTGTTTVGAFAPLYVFNLNSATEAASTGYQALFIYPALQAVLTSASTTDLTAAILTTLTAPDVTITDERGEQLKREAVAPTQ